MNLAIYIERSTGGSQTDEKMLNHTPRKQVLKTTWVPFSPARLLGNVCGYGETRTLQLC